MDPWTDFWGVQFSYWRISTLRRPDLTEDLVSRHLLQRNLGPPIYEPDGNIPPDFLLQGRIAVEARRLNQNVSVLGRNEGLEEGAIPLQQAVKKILAMRSGPPHQGRSWFVHIALKRRPVPRGKELDRLVTAAIEQFRASLPTPPARLAINPSLELGFIPASRQHQSLLLLGSQSDRAAGGFLVSELLRNLQLCIEEKASKIEPFWNKYAEWWLAFEDRIARARLTDDELETVRRHLGATARFSKIILIAPDDPARWIDL